MPCIAGQYNPSVGPVIQVAIIKPTDERVVFDGNADLRMYQALIDTGASNTCISTKVAEDLGLVPTGKTPVAGAHGSFPTNTYQFNVGFILAQQQTASGQLTGSLTQFRIEGSEFANGGCTFDVLLGRDIICKGQFSLQFNGQYVLCF